MTATPEELLYEYSSLGDDALYGDPVLINFLFRLRVYSVLLSLEL